SGLSRELLALSPAKAGGEEAACEPLARGLTNDIELCSMAGRVGERCLLDQPEPWAPPPRLPLPSQGEGQKAKARGSSRSHKRCRARGRSVRQMLDRGHAAQAPGQP